MIGGFYKRVHPDLLSGYPSEAVECNLRSLKELNSYIDRVESAEVVPGPFVARSLQFFQPIYNRNGMAVSRALRPTQISLASIPPSADILTKEELSILLIRDIERSMETERLFSNRSSESKDISKSIHNSSLKGGALVRANLVEIWRKEKIEADVKNAIWENDKASDLLQYKAILSYNKEMKRISKLKNLKSRSERISEAVKLSENILNTQNLTIHDNTYITAKRVIESGFHPDLIFFDPSLNNEERMFGLDHVSGTNLNLDEDIWLLENIWKLVRKEKSVPVVLGKKFQANLQGGYLEIPFDFSLVRLVDFLEDNLESVRNARIELIENNVPI